MSFTHVSRIANKMAHKLAEYALCLERERVWLEEELSCIQLWSRRTSLCMVKSVIEYHIPISLSKKKKNIKLIQI